MADDNPVTSAVPKSSLSTRSPLGRTSKPSPVGESLPLREPSRPIITPLRLVTVGIVLMTALTIGGLWRRSRIEAAKAVVTKATDAGRQAILDRDFLAAATHFEQARKAVDILGRNDDAANTIRQTSREATAIANLSSSTLIECLEETLAAGKRGSTEPLRLSSAIQGAWVIFDSNLSQSAAGKDDCVVDAPVILKDGIVHIEIDSPQIRKSLRENDPGESTRVIFAAQLESLSPYKGDPPISVLTLNGKTAFLWMSYENYKSVGYRPFDQESEQHTRSVLERQNSAKSATN